jgi:hypothetical protein
MSRNWAEVLIFFFTSLHLDSCIWLDAISGWIRRRVCIKFCVNLRRSATKTLTMIRQAFGEEIMCRKRMIEWHSLFRADRKWRDPWKSKSRACLIFFFISRGSFTKIQSWQAKQSVLHTTVTFFTAAAWNVRSLRPEIWRQMDRLLHHDNAPSHTSFFTREFFTTKNMTVVPPPTLLFCFPDWK